MKKNLKYFFIIMLLLVAVKKSGSQDNESIDKIKIETKNSSYEYRVGTIGCFEKKSKCVTLYETINKDMEYHCFLTNGRAVFSSTHFEKTFNSNFDDEQLVFWHLIPDTPYFPFELPKGRYFTLIVGTSNKKIFMAPQLEQVTAKEQKLCVGALIKTDTLPIALNDSITLRYHSAGTDGSTHRIVIEQDYGLVALCQVVKDECQILFTKSLFSNERKDNFCGQADLDGDGLCDIFALNAGDYSGQWVLIHKHGTWMLIQDVGPSP